MKFRVVPTCTLTAPAGVIATVIPGGVRLTVPVPDFDESACDVATTWTEPAVGTEAGARYIPPASIVPQSLSEQPDRLHVTAVLDVPVTVALN